MHSFGRLAFGVLVTLVATAPASAQDRAFNFALRGGAAVVPAYPGANELSFGPDIGFSFGSLEWGRLNVGDGVFAIPPDGWAVRGAFRFVGGRDDDDYSELTGLEDIDPALELGLGVIYRQPTWQAFVDLRQGVGGHEGLTATAGADLIFRPDDRWTVTAGPRFDFGSDAYAATYFGVTAAEAGASSFAAYDAEGGLLGAGIDIVATYRFAEDWAVESALEYRQLLNDAADSPITRAGSEDQLRVRIGIVRAFTLRF